MGYDASTYVVYGKVIKGESIEVTKPRRSCSHAINPSNKFCSECGKPTYTDEKVRLLDAMENKGLSYFYSDHANKEEVVLGFILAEESYSNRNRSPFLNVTQPNPGMDEEIKKFCEEHGIPCKDGDCQTWAFTYHSY